MRKLWLINFVLILILGISVLRIVIFPTPKTPDTPFLNGTTPMQQFLVHIKIKRLVPIIISPSMTNLEKQTAIHDWILTNVEYDSTLEDTDVYSALTTGKTVCGGYATLNALMLNEVGIPTQVIVGKHVYNPTVKHAWNLVNIDEKWLHTDLTWCDEEGDEFVYFNKTDNYMFSEGYLWDSDQYPAMLATN